MCIDTENVSMFVKCFICITYIDIHSMAHKRDTTEAQGLSSMPTQPAGRYHNGFGFSSKTGAIWVWGSFEAKRSSGLKWPRARRLISIY